jgi:hypothetical protein
MFGKSLKLCIFLIAGALSFKGALAGNVVLYSANNVETVNR